MEGERINQVREVMDRNGIDREAVIESSKVCRDCREAVGTMLHLCPNHELALRLASDNHRDKIGRADPMADND